MRFNGMMLARAAGLATLSMMVAAPALAQKMSPQSVDPYQTATYGEFSLNSGFTPDPQVISLTSGGTIDASTVASGCRGMVARAPDVQMTYSAGSLPLTFLTSSSTDTTLLINGPDGRWSCDDDSGESGGDALLTYDNPMSGIYDVWVGAYGGNSGSADLYVTELGGGRIASGGGSSNVVSSGYPDASLNATYGTVSLASGFTGDPYRVSLSAGGGFDASGLGGACVGMIASAPDVQLNFSGGSLPLIISAGSSSDTTLVINGPDGQWYCNDDGGTSGSNPSIRFNAPRSGAYDIWVGSYGGASAPAELHISELYSQ